MWLTIILAVILYGLWKISNREKHCLDAVPGPPAQPIVGNVLDFASRSAVELFQYQRSLAKIYKDRYVIKIFNRRLLQIYNPDDVEALLNHSKNISKNKPYLFLQPWLGTGLINSTGAKWHKRRKILTLAFHFDILRSSLQVLEEKSQELVKELHATDGKEINVYPVTFNLALFTILETAMGTRLNAYNSEVATKYITSIYEIGKLLLMRLSRIWLYNDFIFKRSAIGKRFYHCVETVHNFVDNIIIERRKQKNWQIEDDCDDIGTKKRKAMLDLLLELEEKGDIDLEGIRDEVNTFMFAGHETTGTALTFALMMLADRDDIQERVCEEYRLIMGHRTQPTISDFAEMKYLEAIIKETLRLFSNPPRIGRQVTEDFMLGDILVKAGSEVGILIYDLHHREDLFPNPEEFRPERFINGEVKHPYSFIPFSAGPRNCIGQRYAMLELKCVISKICMNFRLKPRYKNWRVPVVSDMMLRPTAPVYISFTARQQNLIH